MWPFKTKKAESEAISMPSFALKSVTLPESMPQWKLYATKQDRWSIENAIERSPSTRG